MGNLENVEYVRFLAYFCKKCCPIMSTRLYTKKIHMLWGKSMWMNWWIMWITLHTKEVFSDFIYVSCPHSYQHISVDTIF